MARTRPTREETRRKVLDAAFEVGILALSNGLALESDIEADGVKDDLFARTLNILSLDAPAHLTPNNPSAATAAGV